MKRDGRLLRDNILKFGLFGFYLFAGINHFIHPDFYYGLIPDYLHFPKFINISSGALEVVFALGILTPGLQKIAASAIILLLIAFVPSHIYFIKIGSCVENGLCVAPWIAWLRLLIIHPLLILWAWYVGFKIK